MAGETVITGDQVASKGETTVISEEQLVRLLTESTQGPPGPPGPTGPAGPAGGAAASIPAVINLGGQRVVLYGPAGLDGYADASNLQHINRIAGITTAAFEEGTTALVVRSGELTESTWTWTPDMPVFLGLNGTLTQTLPAQAVFSLVVGYALTPTKIFIALREPIALN